MMCIVKGLRVYSCGNQLHQEADKLNVCSLQIDFRKTTSCTYCEALKNVYVFRYTATYSQKTRISNRRCCTLAVASYDQRKVLIVQYSQHSILSVFMN